ncbi:hypothetical protein HY989_02960 [Candidatus Micrarchaeota archaeon]|nr:hypothetical protein [Candidatus Micrarchaeota archaeon]
MGIIIWRGGGEEGNKVSYPSTGDLRIDLAGAGDSGSPIKAQDFGKKASFMWTIDGAGADGSLKPKTIYFSDIFGRDPTDGGLKPKAYFSDIFGMGGGIDGSLKPSKISFKSNYPEDVEGIIVGGGLRIDL